MLPLMSSSLLLSSTCFGMSSAASCDKAHGGGGDGGELDMYGAIAFSFNDILRFGALLLLYVL